MYYRLRRLVAAGVSLPALLVGADVARAQNELPPVVVPAPSAPAPRPKPPRRVQRTPAATRIAAPARPARPTGRRIQRATVPAPNPAGAGEGASAGIAGPQGIAAQTLAKQARMDADRDRILTRAGANAYAIDREAIESRPRGDVESFDKVLLQAPGVTQDSAASGDLHIRNEHANIQYRINGIMLPDGVSGFAQFLDTSFVGKVSLLDGALPAEYGLRTAGVVDITSRTGGSPPEGSVGVYGGSHDTALTTVDYGGVVGKWDFFFAGRLMQNNLGIENPTPRNEAIHDFTQQGQFFGYASKVIDEDTRLSFITGTSVNAFQIPNTPGLPPAFTAFGVSDFNSAKLDESQLERTFYNVVALQKKAGDFDGQLSFFSRYSTLDFYPDTLGDLLFNGVASRVARESLVNGLQGDASYRLSDEHTLRGGFIVSGEHTSNSNGLTLLPLDDSGNPIDAPYRVLDARSKLGWTLGVYAQDEWRISDKLTINGGLRFDQIYQYVDANQVSPRINFVYRPFEGTALHAGYARYFTPPSQVLAAPPNLALVTGSTQEPAVPLADPVLPERADYFDVGVTQKITPALEVGVDAYLKKATDLLDDGQFGSALVLDAFNYAKAENRGVEFKAVYQDGGLRAYGSVAVARQVATQIVSNQYLFDPDELAFIANNYIYTDHAQIVTASAGVSYKWNDTRISADMIYGSGLRDGFANTGTVPDYAQVNLGLTQDIHVPGFARPTTLRFDIVNLFDEVYQIRDGSGIGVFAPQYGPRRGFYGGLTQKF